MQRAGVQLNRLVEVLGLCLHHRGGYLGHCRCSLEELRSCLYRRSRNIFTICNPTELSLLVVARIVHSAQDSIIPQSRLIGQIRRNLHRIFHHSSQLLHVTSQLGGSRQEFHVLLTLKTFENYLLPWVAGNFYTNKLQSCRQKDKFLETVVNSALFRKLTAPSVTQPFHPFEKPFY